MSGDETASRTQGGPGGWDRVAGAVRLHCDATDFEAAMRRAVEQERREKAYQRKMRAAAVDLAVMCEFEHGGPWRPAYRVGLATMAAERERWRRRRVKLGRFAWRGRPGQRTLSAWRTPKRPPMGPTAFEQRGRAGVHEAGTDRMSRG